MDCYEKMYMLELILDECKKNPDLVLKSSDFQDPDPAENGPDPLPFNIGTGSQRHLEYVTGLT